MKEVQKVHALARGHPGVDACAPGSGVMGTCVGAFLLQLEGGRASKRPKEEGEGAVPQNKVVSCTQNPALAYYCIKEPCVELFSPGNSSELTAAMTLRVTKTSSKVVIVHLEEVAEVLFGQLWHSEVEEIT